MVSIGVVLGILGLFIGIAALLVAVEVGRRCQAMLLEHGEQVAVTIREKLNEQEEAFDRKISEQRKRISQLERQSAAEKNMVLEATNRLQTRIGSQDSLISDALSEVRKRIGSLEYLVSAQGSTLSDIQSTKQKRRSRDPASTPTPAPHVT